LMLLRRSSTCTHVAVYCVRQQQSGAAAAAAAALKTQE
jgi:hypothetical protein